MDGGKHHPAAPSCSPWARGTSRAPGTRAFNTKPAQDFLSRAAKLKVPGKRRASFIQALQVHSDHSYYQQLLGKISSLQSPRQHWEETRPACTLDHYSCPKIWFLAPPNDPVSQQHPHVGRFSALGILLLSATACSIRTVPALCKSHRFSFDRVSFIMALIHRPSPIQLSLSLRASF